MFLGDPTDQTFGGPLPRPVGPPPRSSTKRGHLIDLIIYHCCLQYAREVPHIIRALQLLSKDKTSPSRIQQHYQRFCGRNGYRSPEAVKYRRRDAPKRRADQMMGRKEKKGERNETQNGGKENENHQEQI